MLVIMKGMRVLQKITNKHKIGCGKNCVDSFRVLPIVSACPNVQRLENLSRKAPGHYPSME